MWCKRPFLGFLWPLNQSLRHFHGCIELSKVVSTQRTSRLTKWSIEVFAWCDSIGGTTFQDWVDESETKFGNLIFNSSEFSPKIWCLQSIHCWKYKKEIQDAFHYLPPPSLNKPRVIWMMREICFIKVTFSSPKKEKIPHSAHISLGFSGGKMGCGVTCIADFTPGFSTVDFCLHF